MKKYNVLADDIARVLVSEEELCVLTDKVAAQIDEDVKGSGKELLLVCVLKGSLMFTADLARKITTPLKLDFIKASSYGGGTVSSGNLRISLDCGEYDWENKFVVIVEDIIDSGNTLSYLKRLLSSRQPKSIKICTLLDKPSRRVVKFEPDIALFTIPDHFVIGYGLDCGEYYRNLPYIAEYNEKGE